MTTRRANDEARTPGRLAGRVAIVSPAEPDAALALAAAGATVVVVGPEPDAVGALVRRVADAGHRAIAFVGDPTTDADALVEMVAEIFPDRAPGASEPA